MVAMGRQNEAALRITKQQQELELERVQEEQELLRLRTDQLEGTRTSM